MLKGSVPGKGIQVFLIANLRLPNPYVCSSVSCCQWQREPAGATWLHSVYTV